MHDIGCQPVTGLELPGIRQRPGSLQLRQVDGYLAPGCFYKIGILPVKVNLCR